MGDKLSFLSEFAKLNGGQQLPTEGIERIARFQEVFGNEAVEYQHFLLVHEVYLLKQKEQIEALFEGRDSQALERLQSQAIEGIVPHIGAKVADVAAAKIAASDAIAKKKLLSWQLGLVAGLLFVFFSFGMLAGARIIKLPKIQLAASSLAANSLFNAIRDNANPWHLKKLISSGISVNIVDERGDTPLLFAVKQDSEDDLVKALLDSGSDVDAMDKNKRTPLLLSIGNGNRELLSVLIAASADVNMQHGEEGFTPLMVATRIDNPNPEVVSALVKAGAIVTAKNRSNGKMALDYAKENPALKDNSEILNLLEGKKTKK